MGSDSGQGKEWVRNTPEFSLKYRCFQEDTVEREIAIVMRAWLPLC